MRVCVYGSSSARSPKPYLDAAAEVGEILCSRNHVCINGGGSFGCMGAVNDAMHARKGRVVACIHEMWADANEQVLQPCEEIIVVGGDNLAARKRGLNDSADAFIVLPGGPGTWDELWEVVSEVQIGIGAGRRQCPVVLLNVGGYYDGFVAQMKRAYQDGIMYKAPSEVLHVVETAKDAVDSIERAASEAKTSSIKAAGMKNFATDEARTRRAFSTHHKMALAFAAGCVLTASLSLALLQGRSKSNYTK